MVRIDSHPKLSLVADGERRHSATLYQRQRLLLSHCKELPETPAQLEGVSIDKDIRKCFAVSRSHCNRQR